MEERVFEKEGKSRRGDPARAEANEFQHTQRSSLPVFLFFLPDSKFCGWGGAAAVMVRDRGLGNVS